MRAGSSRDITGIEIPLTGRYRTPTWQGSSTPWYKHERTSKLHTQECGWKYSGLHDSATHNSAMAGPQWRGNPNALQTMYRQINVAKPQGWREYYSAIKGIKGDQKDGSAFRNTDCSYRGCGF